MFDGIRNGFRKPKKLTNAQREKQEQAKDFIEKYTKLCEECKLQWDIAYEFNHREGLKASFVLIEHRPKPKEGEFETKDWEECKKENEETRRNQELSEKMDNDVKKIKEKCPVDLGDIHLLKRKEAMEREENKDEGGTEETIKD